MSVCQKHLLGFAQSPFQRSHHENFSNKFLVLGDKIRVDQDVVQIHHNSFVDRSWNMKFMKHWKAVRALVRSSGMTNHSKDPYWVMPEVDFGVDTSLCWGVEEVSDKGKWIPVLFDDSVEGMIIDTKMKGSIFLLGEDHQSAVR